MAQILKGGNRHVLSNYKVELLPPTVYYINDLTKVSLSPQYLILVLASLKG